MATVNNGQSVSGILSLAVRAISHAESTRTVTAAIRTNTIVIAEFLL